MKKTLLNYIVVVSLKHCPLCHLVFSYCDVTNQVISTLCNRQRSLLSTMFSHLQSSQKSAGTSALQKSEFKLLEIRILLVFLFFVLILKTTSIHMYKTLGLPVLNTSAHTLILVFWNQVWAQWAEYKTD